MALGLPLRRTATTTLIRDVVALTQIFNLTRHHKHKAVINVDPQKRAQVLVHTATGGKVLLWRLSSVKYIAVSSPAPLNGKVIPIPFRLPSLTPPQT